MLPGDGITPGIGKDKTCFTKEDQYKFKYGSEGLNTSDIKEYIRNPHKFNINVEMDGKYYNLWSTNNDRTDNNDDVVIKSVYDPSPVGYSLPASNAFTGFTNTGGNVDNGPNPMTPEQKALCNIKGDFNKGYYFYTKPNKTGVTSFFTVTGFRYSNSGELMRILSQSWIWIACHNFTTKGFGFGLSSSYVDPCIGKDRNLGFAVRSAEEKIVLVWLR